MSLFGIAMLIIVGLVFIVLFIMLLQQVRTTKDIVSAVDKLKLRPNTPALSADRLSEVAAKANSQLLILCGICNPSVYGGETLHLLEEKVNQGVEVRILSGPNPAKGDDGKNPIENLAELMAGKGNFKLGLLPNYPADGHFRVADGEYYCIEMPHTSDSPDDGKLISEVIKDKADAAALVKYFNELASKPPS